MKLIFNTRATAAIVSSVVAVVCAMGIPHVATPEDELLDLSAVDIQEFMDNAAYWGVDEETANSLLDKYRRGIPLDSMTGSPPVSAESSTVNGFYRTVKTYTDGSIIGTEVQLPMPAPTDGITPMAGYLGCTTGSSAGVSYGQDCYVYNSSLTVGASFYTSLDFSSAG